MDWNHQGFWAVGAAVAGGLLGVIATNISASSDERMANAPYAERIREAELKIDRMAETISGIQGDFIAQGDALKNLSATSTDLATLSELRTHVRSLSEEMAVLSNAQVTADSVDPEVVAKILATDYADALRGPAGEIGKDGAPGPQGVPGPKGEPGAIGPKGEGSHTETLSDDIFERIVTEATDRTAEKLGQKVAPQVESEENANNSNVVPMVGPMDCLELDRGTAVTVADFKAGGSACLNGVPIFQVTKIRGGVAYFAHSGSSNDRIDAGSQDKFFIAGEYIGISYSLDSNVVDELGGSVLRVRLHWLGGEGGSNPTP